MGSAETEDEQLWQIEARAVGAGAASGFLAGIGMGIVLHVGTELLPVLGAVAGEATAVRGWVVHLVVSVLYGMGFAIIVALPVVARFFEPAGVYDYAFGGIVYAAMVMAAGAAGTIAILPFIMELPWFGAEGQSPIVPGPELLGLVPAAMFGVGHIVYGAILGAAYASIGVAGGGEAARQDTS